MGSLDPDGFTPSLELESSDPFECHLYQSSFRRRDWAFRMQHRLRKTQRGSCCDSLSLVGTSHSPRVANHPVAIPVDDPRTSIISLATSCCRSRRLISAHFRGSVFVRVSVLSSIESDAPTTESDRSFKVSFRQHCQRFVHCPLQILCRSCHV